MAADAATAPATSGVHAGAQSVFGPPVDATTLGRAATAARAAPRPHVMWSGPSGNAAMSASLGGTRVIQRRFNVSVPRARVPEKASALRDRSEG